MNREGLKGALIGLIASLLFLDVSWIQGMFCLGMMVTGYFIGVIFGRIEHE